ncbi:MAG: class I SAM-dependent methyltransferase [Kineosporiaceae bacterium]
MSQEDHGQARTVTANRRWWDASAEKYQESHAAFLAGFVWGPEGLREDDADLLGPVNGRDVLEVGAGAGQCSAWLAARGARPVALDISAGMLRQAPTAVRARAVQADAGRLPFADGAFDVAFSAYGALPFTPAADRVLTEVHRVLRPVGRWVFSVTHPVRWAFPDDPGPAGLRATLSYFSRTPYVETDREGRLGYAEFHRTVGDWVRLITGAGFVLRDLVEPEWPTDHEQEWGGWSRLRGERIPGTAIFVCERP